MTGNTVQDIRLTLVSMPKDSGDVSVRITIQRTIYDKRGRVAEQSTITDADVYESMFAKLSKVSDLFKGFWPP